MVAAKIIMNNRQSRARTKMDRQQMATRSGRVGWKYVNSYHGEAVRKGDLGPHEPPSTPKYSQSTNASRVPWTSAPTDYPLSAPWVPQQKPSAPHARSFKCVLSTPECINIYIIYITTSTYIYISIYISIYDISIYLYIYISLCQYLYLYQYLCLYMYR